MKITSCGNSKCKWCLQKRKFGQQLLILHRYHQLHHIRLEAIKTAILLNSLPDPNRPLVTTLEARDNLTWSILLTTKFLDESKHLKSTLTEQVLTKGLGAPSLRANFISINKLVEKNFTITFKNNKCNLYYQNFHVTTATLQNNLFILCILNWFIYYGFVKCNSHLLGAFYFIRTSTIVSQLIVQFY